MNRKLSSLLALIFCSTAILNAQGLKISGKFIDNTTQQSLPGVGVIVSNLRDTTEKHVTITDNNGFFSVGGLKPQSRYRIRTTYLGFYEMVRIVDLKTVSVNIGTLSMMPQSKMLEDVVVKGQAPPALQKGDTTELNASAFKVNPDANAQDLVQKMPGVTIESGVVKAHGENVQRVMVDGKNYFGDDASMALQNLPAEVVDKVQIYNKMSDQAEFTGFDDGNSMKVMNIVTRLDRRNGTNGLFSAGTDFTDKYAVNARFNTSTGQQRLTLIGGSNNVNQQNFNMQDLLGTFGGGRPRFSGGARNYSYVARQGGINTTHSFGVNYTNVFSPKLTLTGSYFFNLQDNKTDQMSSSQNIISDTTYQAKFQNQSSNARSSNYNHRFDMRLEYTIDSLNSIIWTPRFSVQQNDNSTLSNQLNFNNIELPMYLLNGKNTNNGLGYNYNSDLLFRHKFSKKGRTISFDAAISGSYMNTDGTTWSQTLNHQQLLIDTALIDQTSNSKTRGRTLSGNLIYTEPIGKNGILQFGYNASFTSNTTDKYSYDQTVIPAVQDTALSNKYKNNYNTQRAGITYRIRSGTNFFASVGADYQHAVLTGDQVFPQVSRVDTSFNNILPNAMLNYKITPKSNLRLMYRTSTNPPTVNQLQNVVTVANSLSFTQGNPDLKHEYAQNLMLNYRFSNPDRMTNFSFNLFGGYTMNSIGYSTLYMKNDSIIAKGDTLKQRGQLTKPMNFTESWNSRIFMNYGILFKPINCNFNFIGGVGYTTSPGSVNSILSLTKQYNFTGGLIIGSNISQNVDFTLSYTANYTVSNTTYQGDAEGLITRQGLSPNSEAWYHSISLRSNFIWKGFVLQNSLVEQINSGLSGGYNQNFMQWNIALGKKFLKNNSGELKLSVFDVLNQNQNITHTVSASSISDSQTNTLQRFFLFTFTYNLRNYKAPEGKHDHGPGYGPPPGMRPF